MAACDVSSCRVDESEQVDSTVGFSWVRVVNPEDVILLFNVIL